MGKSSRVQFPCSTLLTRSLLSGRKIEDRYDNLLGVVDLQDGTYLVYEAMISHDEGDDNHKARLTRTSKDYDFQHNEIVYSMLPGREYNEQTLKFELNQRLMERK